MGINTTALRWAARLGGLLLAALGAYGAWDKALSLEGTWSYVVLAAPAVGLCAAALPVFAERQYRDGAYVKSGLLWVAFFLCGAVVYFSVTERKQDARAVSVAAVDAKSSAARDARTSLTQLEADAKDAKSKADEARAWEKRTGRCGPECTKRKATETRLKGEVEEARTALYAAEAKAVTASSVQEPPWLFGAALWAAEVLLIWVGFTEPPPKKARRKRKGWWWQHRKPEPVRRRKPKARHKPTPTTPPAAPNVVPIRAA
jgi:hypothetical protein